MVGPTSRNHQVTTTYQVNMYIMLLYVQDAYIYIYDKRYSIDMATSYVNYGCMIINVHILIVYMQKHYKLNIFLYIKTHIQQHAHQHDLPLNAKAISSSLVDTSSEPGQNKSQTSEVTIDPFIEIKHECFIIQFVSIFLTLSLNKHIYIYISYILCIYIYYIMYTYIYIYFVNIKKTNYVYINISCIYKTQIMYIYRYIMCILIYYVYINKYT